MMTSRVRKITVLSLRCVQLQSLRLVRPSSHGKSSSSCMTAPSRSLSCCTYAQHTSSRLLLETFSSQLLLPCRPTQVECSQSSSSISHRCIQQQSTIFSCTIITQSNPTKCRPQHLSLQPAVPRSAPSYVCETGTTPSSLVTRHYLPHPTMRDLRSQNTQQQRSPKPTPS